MVEKFEIEKMIDAGNFIKEEIEKNVGSWGQLCENNLVNK